EPGYFSFGSETICYGHSRAGFRAPSAAGPLHEALADVTADGRTVRLPLDPNDIIENLRYERYRNHTNGKRTGIAGSPLARSLYYLLRPLLGVAVRKHAQRAYLSDW